MSLFLLLYSSHLYSHYSTAPITLWGWIGLGESEEGLVDQRRLSNLVSHTEGDTYQLLSECFFFSDVQMALLPDSFLLLKVGEKKYRYSVVSQYYSSAIFIYLILWFQFYFGPYVYSDYIASEVCKMAQDPVPLLRHRRNESRTNIPHKNSCRDQTYTKGNIWEKEIAICRRIESQYLLYRNM